MQYKKQYKTPLIEKDQWETPDDIFKPLDSIFSFTIDVTATQFNAKVRDFYAIDDDGLAQDWSGETVFCNPPHTDGAYVPWIKKAREEFHENFVETVMVLPFNSETKGFRPIWKYAHYLVRPYTRIKYELGGVKKGSPTFDSCVVVFSHDSLGVEELLVLSQIGYVIDLFEGVFPGYIK